MTDKERLSAADAVADDKQELVYIEPSVLVWARKSLGLDEERAAKKIGVVVGTLIKWEAGAAAPTLPQLRRIAAAYKRPLAVLLLPAPARDFDALRDFRAGFERKVAVQSPELTSEYWRAMSQRDVLLEIAELSRQGERAARPPKLTLNTAAEDAGTALREWLGPARWPRSPLGLPGWIAAAEAQGVLVIQTRGVQRAEMSGFSVSEWPYPIVALNGSDYPRRRLFTLAHELAHLALNAGGLCDLADDRDATAIEDRIELFCNRAAGAALMPLAVLTHIAEYTLARPDKRWNSDQLERLAQPFGTSAESMLLRLITLGKATWDAYWDLKPQFEEAYAAARADQKEAEGGPSFYVVKARDLGPGYVRTVLEAFRGRTITSLDVADYLDVRFEQIPKLERAAR